MEVETLAQACATRRIELKDCIYKREACSIYLAIDLQSAVNLVLKVHTFSIDEEAKEIMKEIDSQTSLRHPNIVVIISYFYYYQSLEKWETVIVLEKMDSDLMAEVNKREKRQAHWSDTEILKMSIALLDVFSYCEAMNFCHRDIKPQNIFWNEDGLVKVGDFGSAKSVGNLAEEHTVIGSPLYLSPLLRAGYARGSRNVTHDPNKSDVFSLGMTLLTLCLLRAPFDLDLDSFEASVITLISELPYCDLVKNLILNMLIVNEDDRPSFQALFVELMKYVEYEGMCPHVARGSEICATFPCHGDLCQYCIRINPTDTRTCRLCLQEYPRVPATQISEPPGIPIYENPPQDQVSEPDLMEKCALCEAIISTEGLTLALKICVDHKACSKECVLSYCSRAEDKENIACKICHIRFSENLLETVLSGSDIPGLTFQCINCQNLKSRLQAFPISCQVHQICIDCFQRQQVDLERCQICVSPEYKCDSCKKVTIADDLYRFECTHSICSLCLGPNHFCKLCTTQCPQCQQFVPKQIIQKLACSHQLCSKCYEKTPTCERCIPKTIFCSICRQKCRREDSYELDCGNHHICVYHLQNSDPDRISLCQTCRRNGVIPCKRHFSFV